MPTCKFCKKQVDGSHYCSSKGRVVDEVSDSDFILSALIGYATNSTVLGGMIGGDIVGSLIGDLLNDD